MRVAGSAAFGVASPRGNVKDADMPAPSTVAAVGVPAIAKVCGIDTQGARVLP